MRIRTERVAAGNAKANRIVVGVSSAVFRFLHENEERHLRSLEAKFGTAIALRETPEWPDTRVEVTCEEAAA